VSRRQTDDCLSDLRLDQWLAGEFIIAQQRGAEFHIDGCDACQRRRSEIAESRRSFTRDAPPLATLERTEPSSPEQAHAHSSEFIRSKRRQVANQSAWSARSRWLAAVSALAAAAAIALVVSKPWPSAVPPTGEDKGSATRTKGGLANLSWVVRRGDRVFAGRPDQRLRAGDAVRFIISAREPVYVAILGLDASGRPSVYYPDGDELARIGAGRDQPLSAAIELDAAPVAQQIYGVFCPSPVPLSRVRSAIGNSPDAPPLPGGCTQERWALQKEAP
jgi:hypothetical protein